MSYGASAPELKGATANTRQGSQEEARVAPEPTAYLRLDTGEVIGVPAGEVTALNNEFDKWNRLIHEQLLANEALAICDARLEAIADELAVREKSVPDSVVKEAEKAQGFALQWREQATDKLRTAMLYLLDIAQLSAAAKGKAMPGKPYDMGAIRVAAAAELKGVIGVSIAGEISLGVAMKDIETTDLDGKKKPAKEARLSGKRNKAKRARKIDVSGQADDWKNTAGVAAEVSLFAGAKGGLELKGSLQWRNPHKEKKGFEAMASIAPELQGQAGIGASAKLMVDYVDGVFRVTAHAGICFGLGAEGTVSFAVNFEQIGSFIYWLYYNLLNVGFRNLVILSEEAFKVFTQLCYLMVCQGKRVEEYFLKTGDDLKKAFADMAEKYEKAQASHDLGKRILANPNQTRFSPPESKGILIYQLTRHGKESFVVEPGLGSGYLRTQKGRGARHPASDAIEGRHRECDPAHRPGRCEREFLQ